MNKLLSAAKKNPSFDHGSLAVDKSIQNQYIVSRKGVDHANEYRATGIKRRNLTEGVDADVLVHDKGRKGAAGSESSRTAGSGLPGNRGDAGGPAVPGRDAAAAADEAQGVVEAAPTSRFKPTERRKLAYTTEETIDTIGCENQKRMERLIG